MSGCLHMPCNRPEWLDFTDRRNAVYSVVAGSLFAIGWWIMIDCAARHPSSAELNHAYHTIGVISTLSLIMVNVVSNAQVRGERVFTNGVCGPAGARVWLFIGFVLGFAALLGSSWILVATNFYSTSLSVFLQNAFIFASSMAFKFGRKESDSWGS
ncbi:transmembrane protein 50B-like [Varroa jacobsoni]|uniref:Transmembrane protein 50B n=1 Tax=Varroa destructor TaxID=109461 RepID=A0A7M7J2K2_VARDE|nr:transmembrane protein 50B-like isoform X1 [Varroa destructor]XP_022703754.1 transmembrane protein 50B-like [Varroa jacobsoni]